MQKPVAIFGEQEDDYLKPEIVFPLDTNKDRFADWVAQKLHLQFNKKAREAVNRMTPDGRFSSVTNQIDEHDLIALQKEFPSFGHVLFEIFPISDKTERIEVSIAYTDKAFLLMAEILTMIAISYPESSNIIEKYLTLALDIPIRQFLVNRLILSQELIARIEDIGGKLQNAGIEDGKSLTVYQMDLITQLALYNLYGSVRELHFERVEHNTWISYTITVWQDVKSCQISLGVYLVFKGEDGMGRWGWQTPLPDVDAECQRLRGLILMKITNLQSNYFYLAYMKTVPQKTLSPKEHTETTNTITLPKIEDPTDQRLWDWIKEDPSITDSQLAQKLDIGRQAVNERRRRLEAMGYPVRVSRQK